MNPPELEDAVWRKSSHSPSLSECVEVAEIRRGVAVRDSKNPAGGALVLTASQFTGLLQTIRTDLHDL